MKQRHIYTLSNEELSSLGNVIEFERRKGFKLVNVEIKNCFSIKLMRPSVYVKDNEFTFEEISED